MHLIGIPIEKELYDKFKAYCALRNFNMQLLLSAQINEILKEMPEPTPMNYKSRQELYSDENIALFEKMIMNISGRNIKDRVTTLLDKRLK